MVFFLQQARNHLISMRNSFYLMLCLSVSITLMQMLASLVLLPPVLASQHLLWLVLIVIPSLSVTLMASPVDPRIMSLATGKNLNHIMTDVSIIYILIKF